MINPEYQKLLNKSEESHKEIRSFLKKVRKHKQLDTIFREAHERTFEKIDCLQCANCCKTTSPIFRNTDIRRIAKHLRIKESKFISDSYEWMKILIMYFKRVLVHFLERITHVAFMNTVHSHAVNTLTPTVNTCTKYLI